MMNYTIENSHDNVFKAFADDTGEYFEGDYFKILSDIVDYAGPDEEICVDLSLMENKEFPSRSAKRLTRIVIEMHNKLAIVKNTLTQPQLDIIIKD